jgi:predicted peroxiredoxin
LRLGHSFLSAYLVAATNLQAELFTSVADADLAARSKSEKLSRAIDKINHFGRDSILIGMTPS